jgi:hypothetical protein
MTRAHRGNRCMGEAARSQISLARAQAFPERGEVHLLDVRRTRIELREAFRKEAQRGVRRLHHQELWNAPPFGVVATRCANAAGNVRLESGRNVLVRHPSSMASSRFQFCGVNHRDVTGQRVGALERCRQCARLGIRASSSR